MLAVTKQTIQNCFVKSGFKSIVDCDVLNDADGSEEIFQSFKDKIYLKYATFKDYVAQDLCTVETLNDNAIIQRILQKHTESKDEEVITHVVLEMYQWFKNIFNQNGWLFWWCFAWNEPSCGFQILHRDKS